MMTSAYDADKYGKENRLLFWLRLDKWHLHETALLFVDVDPDSFNKEFTNLITFREYTFDVYADLDSKYEDLRRILYNPDIEHDTPKNWIDRASLYSEAQSRKSHHRRGDLHSRRGRYEGSGGSRLCGV